MPNALLRPMEGHTTMQEQVENQLTATDALKQRLWRQTIPAFRLSEKWIISETGRKNDDIFTTFHVK